MNAGQLNMFHNCRYEGMGTICLLYTSKTFTVGFDYDKFNEISYAKDLSEKIGTQNYSKLITEEEYWSVLPEIKYYMDEPLAEAS